MTEPEARRSRGPLLRRLALVALAIAAAALLYRSGAFDDPERTASFVRDAGAWGAIAYVLAFSFLQPLGVSAHVFGVAAAAIWGPAFGFALALTGAVGSACVSFAYGRYIAYEWVQSRITPRLRRYESWVVERGFVGLFLFRLITFTMIPAQLLLGTLRVRWGPMIVATAIGFAPTVAVDILLGDRLWAWLTT